MSKTARTFAAVSPITGTVHTVTTSREIGAFGFIAWTEANGTVTELVVHCGSMALAEKRAQFEKNARTKPRPSNTQMAGDRIVIGAAPAEVR